MNYKHLQLPLMAQDIKTLRIGDACLLAGTMYILRDAGHARLLDELQGQRSLPYDLAGETIFYAGPTPAKAGRPFGAIGPTTASRMDFAAPRLYDEGVMATIGKGRRSPQVVDACRRNKGLYFIASGGAAALLAQCITDSIIIAYEDLGTEALRKIEVKDFPVFVGIDAFGNDLYAS